MARRLRTSSRLDRFVLTVQPMAPRQLPMSNVADSDVRLAVFLDFSLVVREMDRPPAPSALRFRP